MERRQGWNGNDSAVAADGAGALRQGELVWGDKAYPAVRVDVEGMIAGWNGAGENWQPRTGEV